jgi:hypothetical protein
VASQLLVSKASGETMARARLTGKHGDWQAPKNAYPNNWQQCPYRCEKKATQPAFILINESNKNTGPISTVILVGQHGRLDFDLKEPLGLYMLFEAALDSELAFQQKFRCPLATLPSMEMVRANMEAHHRLQRENERHFAHLIDAERAWLRRRNYKVQLKSRIRFLQSHLPRSGRSPRKPYRPSGLQYGLLSTVPAAFHFYTGQMENAAGFLPHPFKPKPSTTITLDGTPGCERDRVALRRMMTHTVVFLAHKNAPLSMELRELQAKICDFATQNEQESTSVVSSAITSTAPREWSQNTKDEVHIICRKDVTDSFNVWVLVAGYGRKKWVVKIQRQQTEHLQASTQAVAGFKRKADDAVEELE